MKTSNYQRDCAFFSAILSGSFMVVSLCRTQFDGLLFASIVWLFGLVCSAGIGCIVGGLIGSLMEFRFERKKDVLYWIICFFSSCFAVGVLALLLFLSEKYRE